MLNVFMSAYERQFLKKVGESVPAWISEDPTFLIF